MMTRYEELKVDVPLDHPRGREYETLRTKMISTILKTPVLEERHRADLQQVAEELADAFEECLKAGNLTTIAIEALQRGAISQEALQRRGETIAQS